MMSAESCKTGSVLLSGFVSGQCKVKFTERTVLFMYVCDEGTFLTLPHSSSSSSSTSELLT